MKQAIETMDFWEYVARIQDEVGKEVLEQVTDDEYVACVRTISDYMYNLRNFHVGRIKLFNKGQNKYIPLINEALKKRDIFIHSDYISIAF